jgi:hypothetical protein
MFLWFFKVFRPQVLVTTVAGEPLRKPLISSNFRGLAIPARRSRNIRKAAHRKSCPYAPRHSAGSMKRYKS